MKVIFDCLMALFIVLMVGTLFAAMAVFLGGMYLAMKLEDSLSAIPPHAIRHALVCRWLPPKIFHGRHKQAGLAICGRCRKRIA